MSPSGKAPASGVGLVHSGPAMGSWGCYASVSEGELKSLRLVQLVRAGSRVGGAVGGVGGVGGEWRLGVVETPALLEAGALFLLPVIRRFPHLG